MPLVAVSQNALDDAAFAALLEQHRARVLHFLARLCASEAEDLLQETLTKVWRLRHAFSPDGNAEAWLLQAAFRTFCDHRARCARRPVGDGSVEGLEAPQRPCAIELRDEVEVRLQGMPPLQRELLTGFHRDGATLEELAARHGLPLNTVKSHLHRARARLAANGGRDDAR
jgi:RNA polymerase sigma-70 factor (ECF subfamily)